MISDTIVEWALLPHPVQRALLTGPDRVRLALAGSNHLPEDLATTLIGQADRRVVARLVEKGRLSAAVMNVLIESSTADILVDKVTCWYAEHTAALPTQWVVSLRAGDRLGPDTAAALLRRADIDTAGKRDLLPDARYGTALGWLAGPDGADCDDDELLAVLCRSDVRVNDDLVQTAARLLYTRPALIEPALTFTESPIPPSRTAGPALAADHRQPALLRALAAVPLTGSQQLRVLKACNRVFFDDEDVRPLWQCLLRSPWCTEQTFTACDEYVDVAAIFGRKGWPWRQLRGIPVRRLSGWRRLGWLLGHATLWSGQLSAEFVWRELLANPAYDGPRRHFGLDEVHTIDLVQQERAKGFRRTPTAQCPVRSGLDQPVWPAPTALAHGDEPLRSNRTALTTICWYVFHRIGGDCHAWRLALATIDEFDGTLAQFADTILWVCDRIGGDEAAWEVAHTLAAEFAGMLDDLPDTALALAQS